MKHKLIKPLVAITIIIVSHLAVCQALADESSLTAGESADDDGDQPPGIVLPYTAAFGGQYRIMASGHNFGWHSLAISDEQPSGSLVNQRLRTWINFHDAKRKDHGVYLQLEIGHTAWGDDFEFTKTHGANASEVGIELRRGYLWYKPGDDSLLRVGVIDWQDRFGERPTFADPMWSVDAYDTFGAVLANSIWDFNVGGVSFESVVGSQMHYRLSALVLEKSGETLMGEGASLLYGADLDAEFGTSLLGASIYYLDDNGGYSYGQFGGPGIGYDSSWDLWIGARAHLKLGAARSSFFFIYNKGEVDSPRWQHSGWAGKAAVGYNSSFGRISLQALYSTGNDNSSPEESGEFRTIAQSERDNFGAQGYWSLLGLTSPRGPTDIRDLGAGLQNRGLGLNTLQVSLERKLGVNLSAYLAAGWLRSAEVNPVSDASDMGIEILGEVHWSISKNLGLDLGAAYLAAGDFYRSGRSGPSPEGLFVTYARYQLEF